MHRTPTQDEDAPNQDHGEGGGLPGDPEAIWRFASRLKQRVTTGNLDALVVVDGPEGSGKSTLALQLARLYDPGIGMEQIHFSGSSFVEWATEAPKGSVGIVDEFVDGGFNRNAMTSANKAVVRYFIEGRALQHLVFACIPRYHNLDEYIRNHRAAYRLHVPERGTCIVYEPTPSRFQRETYHREVLRFGFGPMDEEDDLWVRYNEKKESRIREQNDPSGMAASGLSKTDIRKIVENVDGYGPAWARTELVENGHLSPEAADLYLEARL